MARADNAQNKPLVSDAKLRETMRRLLHRAMRVDRAFTRATLAAESGVNIYTIDQIVAPSPEKHRRITVEDAFSITCVLGEAAVNALLATIGYGGATPLDETETMQPVTIVTTAMQQLGRIAKAAADNRIDHTEERDTAEAADILIATVLPLSSAGRAA